MFCDTATEDFFRARLDHMLDLGQPLPVLASRMPWQQIEASVAHVFSLLHTHADMINPQQQGRRSDDQSESAC